MTEDDNNIDYSKLEPWNPRDYPVAVNSIRYNQDFSLLIIFYLLTIFDFYIGKILYMEKRLEKLFEFKKLYNVFNSPYNNQEELTLGTSKGYRNFLTSNLRLAHEQTEAVSKLGDIEIAMTYYKSSLVFILPSRSNKDFPNNELIVFDDFYQTKFATFKDKSEEILNFFVSKNVIFLITLSKIIVLEIFSFQVIDIIININSINALLSFNFYDFIAYTELKDKQNAYVKFYQNKNHTIFSSINCFVLS